MMNRALILGLFLCNFGVLTPPVSGQGVFMVAENRGFLGVSIREVVEDDVNRLGLAEERGVYIESVEEATPAEAAGILIGDVVIEYQGIPVLSVRQFQRLVSDTPPGRTVEMLVNRNGQELQLNVEVGTPKHIVGRKGRGFGLEGRGIKIPDLDLDLEALPNHRFFYSTVHPKHPLLGINATALTDQMAEFLGIPGKTGVLVLEVLKDMPAERAGLMAGDVIISIDGNEIKDVVELRESLCDCELKLELIRRGSNQTVTVDLVEEGEKKKNKEESSRI
jgi:serine protease Do